MKPGAEPRAWRAQLRAALPTSSFSASAGGKLVWGNFLALWGGGETGEEASSLSSRSQHLLLHLCSVPDLVSPHRAPPQWAAKLPLGACRLCVIRKCKCARSNRQILPWSHGVQEGWCDVVSYKKFIFSHSSEQIYYFPGISGLHPQFLKTLQS